MDMRVRAPVAELYTTRALGRRSCSACSTLAVSVGLAPGAGSSSLPMWASAGGMTGLIVKLCCISTSRIASLSFSLEQSAITLEAQHARVLTVQDEHAVEDLPATPCYQLLQSDC